MSRRQEGSLVKEDPEVGNTVFSDVCGRFETRFFGKGKYFVSFTEGKSRYIEVMIMKKSLTSLHAHANILL